MITAFKYIKGSCCCGGGSNELLLLPHTCVTLKPFGILPCSYPFCCSFCLPLHSVSRGSGFTSAHAVPHHSEAPSCRSPVTPWGAQLRDPKGLEIWTQTQDRPVFILCLMILKVIF